MSAKGTAARHQSGKELAIPLGGALDTVPVLRVFSKAAQAAGRDPETGKEPHASKKPSGESVVRGYLVVCEAVVVRSGQDPIVVNLDLPTPEPATDGSSAPHPFHPES